MNNRTIKLHHNYLCHEGILGMRWGYTDGKKNGKRVAGEEDEEKTNKKSTDDSKNESMSKDEVSEVVNKIIRGDYGNGADRVKALTEAGYDYKTMQGYVNGVLAGKDIDMSKMDKAETSKTDRPKSREKNVTSSSVKEVKRREKIESVKKQVNDLLKKLSELEDDN